MFKLETHLATQSLGDMTLKSNYFTQSFDYWLVVWPSRCHKPMNKPILHLPTSVSVLQVKITNS